jgi:hypothetical protein
MAGIRLKTVPVVGALGEVHSGSLVPPDDPVGLRQVRAFSDRRPWWVRNGNHQSREVLTSAGAVEVTAPRVNDKRTDPDSGERQRFSSAILPAWARKTPKVTEVLPLLYLHGLSPGDFVPALGQFLGSSAGLPAARGECRNPHRTRKALPTSRSFVSCRVTNVRGQYN